MVNQEAVRKPRAGQVWAWTEECPTGAARTGSTAPAPSATPPDRHYEAVREAAALVGEPQDFLMDEPLSNLHAELRVSWDGVIGADQTGHYKTRPEAYLRRAAVLRLDPGEVMLAAAHNHDLAAARECGLAAAFISRPTEFGAEQTTDLAAGHEWNLDVRAITGLAEAMGCGPRQRNEVVA